MDEQERSAILKETFNTVSDGYDSKALRFFPASAEHLASLLALRGDEHVLDVACGTGHASLAVARRLTAGRVTAVDFSAGMLDRLRRKAALLKMGNIDFLERDMRELGLPENHFDAAVCAFGIFFVEDMDRQLSQIASTVKPGGRIMLSNFQENYFQPLKEMFASRITTYGVQVPPQTWKRIATEAGCRELFEKAGLKNIAVDRKNVGYYLNSAEQWWDVVWNAGFRRMVSQLKPAEQEQFKREHLQEVEALKTKDGIRLDVGVLYTLGMKPEER